MPWIHKCVTKTAGCEQVINTQICKITVYNTTNILQNSIHFMKELL